MKSRSREDPFYRTLDLDPLEPELFVARVSVHIGEPTGFLRMISETIEGELVQAIDTGWIVGPRHLQAAAINSLLADVSGTSWIHDPSLRVLAYLSLETQVRNALAKAGIKVGRDQDVTICSVFSAGLPPSDLLEAVESLENVSIEKHPFRRMDDRRLTKMAEQYAISAQVLHQTPPTNRIELLTDMLLERMALLPVGT